MAENTSDYSEYLRKKLAEKTSQTKETEEVEAKVSELPTPERLKPKKESKKIEEEKPKEKTSSIVPDWKENIVDDKRSSKSVNKAPKTKEGSKSVLKTIGIVALSVVLVMVLVVGGYFAYLQMSFSRIMDNVYLEVVANQPTRVGVGQEYTISTFNIGFGAYSQSYSFFMDEGELADGTKTKGEYARGLSEEDIKNNISGAISLLKSKTPSDFYFFQEVDTDSTRSFYVNQLELIRESFPSFASIYAENAHSSYLFYPLKQPIGTINSGILTMSRFNVDYSVRKSLEIETGMIDKLFDLDRCFSVTKLPVASENKDLVLINVHLSAYDDGSIREKQIAALYDYMNYEYNTNGNYVIVGGDFNLSLAGDYGVFNNGMKTPAWCKNFPEGYDATAFGNIGYSINYDISTTTGTCRDASIKYTEGINLEVVIDGFMTSANVGVIQTEVVDGEFKNSDHNPVKMKFILK